MESFEPKKLALLRIKQILEEYSDYDHPLTQEEIRELLNRDYDLDIERMQSALNFLLGEHDFSSFKSSGTLNPSKVCIIYEKSYC